ncbi:muscle M-line assembly protein unc-89 [Elysia marginata]|uniref:Muscle M-line assembly protein unc-89 n=1 Tax=Elysia marginata TaxID=1093978 RepID=A0AAV4HTH0_9GAST|nr:muscle M-line assembly protein unc-89 [Elysia marginata]
MSVQNVSICYSHGVLFRFPHSVLSSTHQVRRDGPVVELTLSETFAEHEGVYTCRALNSAGFAETSCVLRLAVSEKSEGGRAFEGPVSLPPRIITLTPKAVSLSVGSPLTLTATFTGEPPPTVAWMLAGREIVAGVGQWLYCDKRRMDKEFVWNKLDVLGWIPEFETYLPKALLWETVST